MEIRWLDGWDGGWGWLWRRDGHGLGCGPCREGDGFGCCRAGGGHNLGISLFDVVEVVVVNEFVHVSAFVLSVGGIGAWDIIPVGSKGRGDGEVRVNNTWGRFVFSGFAEMQLLARGVKVEVDVSLPFDADGVSRNEEAAWGAPTVDRARIGEVERVDAVVFFASLVV